MNTRNYFAYLLMLYIASTLVFSIGSNIIITRVLNLVLIGSFLIYFLSYSEIKLTIHRFLWVYTVFALFSLSSIFWSIDSSSTIDDSFRVIIIVINLIIIYNVSRYFKIENFILYGILLGAFYNYAVLFEIISFTSQYTLHFTYRFVGTTNNPNVLAIYMLFCIFASIVLSQEHTSKAIRLLLSINIILALYTIIMTASKKGAVFGVMLLSVYFISSLKSKKNIIGSLILLSVFVFLLNSGLLLQIEGVEHLIHRLDLAQAAFNSNTNTGSTGVRLYLIKTAYEVFSNNFYSILFGTGESTFALQNKLGLYAHNNYMEILPNLGLIGLILFYSIYYVILRKIMTLKNNQMKYFFIGFIIVLLLMDNALVSYDFKAMFFMFVFIVLHIENKNLEVTKQ